MSTTLPPIAGPSPAHEAPQRGGPGRRALALLLAGSAILGGGVGAGALAAAGALDGGGTTTIIERVPAAATTAAGRTAAGALDAGAVYADAAPGVVDIAVTSPGAAAPGPFGQGGGEVASGGSGFVIDGQGHILTAAHVVDGADEVTVRFSDGTSRAATVLGTDDATDVAVLRIDPAGLELHPLELGSSAALEVGDELVVIGSPFGYEASLSTGVVSGLDRTIEAANGFTIAHAIQTDAALNPGNSGGPVLDAAGRVVGISDQIATGQARQSAGVGFAVPIDVVAGDLDALKAGREVRHAYLGISTSDSSDPAGALIGDVAGGGPAADAGLRAGDVVTAVDGRPITGSAALVAAIADAHPGDRIALRVTRGDEPLTVTATLAAQPRAAGAPVG
ncbi:S1C family serine protease [Miltoncostaea marina]|uniref:S1C family serine protease n=1 Tax=Miltoncostaea marina TaxID=2843215 RepID=UPI001C3DD77D|nr:trypsin-like peptidase domain-containing protein [Miltoncostaea marina]